MLHSGATHRQKLCFGCNLQQHVETIGPFGTCCNQLSINTVRKAMGGTSKRPFQQMQCQQFKNSTMHVQMQG